MKERIKKDVLIGWLRHSFHLLKMHHYDKVYDADSSDKIEKRDKEFLEEIIRRLK